MARYIKANPKVAQYLRVENDRNRLADGNYLLWQSDMLEFGRLTNLPSILSQIGAIVLAAHEAKEEQDGTVLRELPTATDSLFVVEPAGAEGATDAGETIEEPEPAPAGGETETVNETETQL